jgi:hydroxyacylglutathione hydrolase
MKIQNRQGPEVIGAVKDLVEFTTAEVASALADDSAILLDTRHNSEVHQGTVPRSLNVPGTDKAASYGAWVYNPETENRPLILLAADEAEAAELRDHLVRVGIDRVAGFVTTLDGLNLVKPQLVSPTELDAFERVLLLDVRNKTEFADGHIPGAEQLSGGRLMWSLDELPSEGTIVTYCQSGVRNSVAASALRRDGYNVAELDGSYLGWAAMPGAVPAA